MSYSYQPALISHTQNTPDTLWTIVHNLDTLAPVVDVYIQDASGAYLKAIPQNVLVITSNEVHLIFSEPRAGKATVK